MVVRVVATRMTVRGWMHLEHLRSGIAVFRAAVAVDDKDRVVLQKEEERTKV